MTQEQWELMQIEAQFDPSIAQYIKNNVFHNGQRYYVPNDQTPLDEIDQAALQKWQAHNGGFAVLPDGRYAIRGDLADEYGRQINQAGGIKGFLNGPGAVLLPMGILGAATMGAAAAGGSGTTVGGQGTVSLAGGGGYSVAPVTGIDATLAGMTGAVNPVNMTLAPAAGGLGGTGLATAGASLADLANIPTSPLTQGGGSAPSGYHTGYSGSTLPTGAEAPVIGDFAGAPAAAGGTGAATTTATGLGGAAVNAAAGGLDMSELGSGEAGMSGQAGNPSYSNTSGVPTGTGNAVNMGGSLWEKLFSGLGLPSGMSGQIPQILGALGSFFGSKELADSYLENAAKAAAMSDPFASQRPYYQDILKQSYTNPNFFANNGAFTGMRDQAVNSTASKMASMGYNMSGNQISEMAKVATDTGYKFAQPWQAQVAQNAGAGISPGYAGYLAQQGGNMAAQTNYNALGNLGVAGQGLWNIVSKL